MNSAYLLGLVSEKVRTVSVAFEPNGKAYTYLTLLETLEPGQDVVVEVGNEIRVDGKPALKVATVVAVDSEVNVDPASGIKFRWVVSDLGTGARAKQAELHTLEANVIAILAKAEKAKRRKEIAKSLADAVGDETLAEVRKLADSALFVPTQEN